MTKIHRPIRLISYDTDENIKRRARGEPAVYRLVRPRTILYAGLMALVGALMLLQLTSRHNMGLSVLHVRAPMYTTTKDDGVRNGYTLRFSNKWSDPRKFAIEVAGSEGRFDQERGGRCAARRAALRHRRPRRDARSAALCHRPA